MQGSPKVIAALNTVLAHTLALHQDAHLEEHYFEGSKYDFSGWFDKIETKAHDDLTHNLMNRIRNLGGKMLVSWAWEPSYKESIGGALNLVLDDMQKTHDAYNKACDVAESDEDYVTVEMIWGHLKKLEKWMVCFEARIAQLEQVGESAFLAEYL